MKNLLIVFLVVCFSVNLYAQKSNSIQGAWQLISGKYGMSDNPMERNQPDKPFQIKLFTDKHFAYVMQKPDGSFEQASAGSYTIQGDQYIETHNWNTDSQYNGFTFAFTYQLQGDKLVMKGPVKVLDAKGQVAKYPQMEEVRIRAK